jgi:hypothetical protein
LASVDCFIKLDCLLCVSLKLNYRDRGKKGNRLWVAG